MRYNCDQQPHVQPPPVWYAFEHPTLPSGQLDLHPNNPARCQLQRDILEAGKQDDYHCGGDYAENLRNSTRPGYSYVVLGPLDGPLAGSGRPSMSKDPLGPIMAGKPSTRSTRNESAEYVEDPDDEVELEDGFASDGEWGTNAPEDGDSPVEEKLTAEQLRQEAKQSESLHGLTTLYVCETGTVYTTNDEHQPVLVGNYLAKERIDALPAPGRQGEFATSYDLETYTMCRESQPHDLFPPCTCCYGALQDEGVICRLDADCPMVALDNLHMCPDCSLSLAACHAQSTAECPEPTRAAVRLLRILWSMAVQCKDPNLFFIHYPNVHATDQAWALSADAINSGQPLKKKVCRRRICRACSSHALRTSSNTRSSQATPTI